MLGVPCYAKAFELYSVAAKSDLVSMDEDENAPQGGRD